MLYKLLILLGFEQLDKTQSKPRTPSASATACAVTEKAAQLLTAEAAPVAYSSEAADRWWDDSLASAWTTVQQIYEAEICDGVVEKEILEQVLVPPVGYLMLKAKVVEELESREDQDGLTFGHDTPRGRANSLGSKQAVAAGSKPLKPSIDTLCQRLGITISRIQWLHHLFESFLQPDEDDPNTVPVCLYPDCPAAIKKAQMRQLMKELRPNMEEVEFEMRFRRIDTDLSNMIEFDEFVMWVREDEVRVGGAAPLQKMSFEELAVVYSESIELVKYVYDHWQDHFPEGEKDDYPKHPRSLQKADVRALVASLTPDMSDADFEMHFQMTTFSQKDTLDFDEVLEVLPLDDLPHEILEGQENDQ
jgi:hypothetical protein